MTATNCTTTLVSLPADGPLRTLVGDIATAALRSATAEPGDRTDVVRYERLCSQLESHAWRAAAGGAPCVVSDDTPDGPGLPVAVHDMADPIGSALTDRVSHHAARVVRRWLDEQNVVVALTVPFAPGGSGFHSTDRHPPGRESAPDVAAPWRAPDGVEGRRAVEARFRAQVAAAVGPHATGQQSVSPSGVHNRVLTEVLRQYVAGHPDRRVDVPIAYRDGSAAADPFPLRCLRPADGLPSRVDVTLHLALLSIRHTEMDARIDGAWLRNAEVSRPRPAAQTDEFVYAASLEQLAALTDHGRRTALLHLYQTGLDCAVVGFYRAVTVHLLRHPGSVAVVPMFAATSQSGGPDETVFYEGEPWAAEGLR
ncbi:hypothetical protein AB0N18_20930 [Streptomyces griseoincarnatus]